MEDIKDLEVLIVEDDAINRLIAVKLFQKHLNLSVAKDGYEAIEMASKQSFDVILMDINLGDITMDGIDVMNKIRQNFTHQKAKIYALTAYSLPNDKEKFLKEGFDYYFSKPFDKNMILQQIAKNCLQE